MSVKLDAPTPPDSQIFQALQTASQRTSQVINKGKELVGIQLPNPAQELRKLLLPPKFKKLLLPSIKELELILDEVKGQYKNGPERQYTVIRNNRGQTRELLHIQSWILENEANSDAITNLVYTFRPGSSLNIFSDLSGDPLPYLETIMGKEGIWFNAWQVTASIITLKCVEEGLSSKNLKDQTSWVIKQLKLEDLVTPQAGQHIFICYSDKDKKWFDMLMDFLKPLEQQKRREGMFKIWADTQIPPGAKWREEINKALASAKVAVLLVTQQFINTDLIAKYELPSILKAAEEKGLIIFWIACEASTIDDTDISNFQSANDKDHPLDSLIPGKRRSELVKIYEKIKEATSNSSL